LHVYVLRGTWASCPAPNWQSQGLNHTLTGRARLRLRHTLYALNFVCLDKQAVFTTGPAAAPARRSVGIVEKARWAVNGLFQETPRVFWHTGRVSLNGYFCAGMLSFKWLFLCRHAFPNSRKPQ
jgi:hypothetical protein